jgi:hypothetical protein
MVLVGVKTSPKRAKWGFQDQLRVIATCVIRMQSNAYELKIIIYAALRWPWKPKCPSSRSVPNLIGLTTSGRTTIKAAPRAETPRRGLPERRRDSSPGRRLWAAPCLSCRFLDSARIHSSVISLRMTDSDAVATDSLPTCNAEACLRMRHCIARASHFHRAKFIPNPGAGQRSIVAQIPAMMPSLI